ncbi:MAG: hypothetical protein BRD42_05615 [Bacteroidetes bacterium QS_3_64_15]|nr:MAG: hypothetical protein BRD42_05615 [Bacteroidetes bacterium QS_3_64_15]
MARHERRFKMPFAHAVCAPQAIHIGMKENIGVKVDPEPLFATRHALSSSFASSCFTFERLPSI